MSIPKTAPKIGRPDPDPELRQLLSSLLKKSTKSRRQIADAMSEFAGIPISTSMLNDWTAKSKKGARFPVCLIQSFSQAVGNDELQRWAMGPKLLATLKLGECAAEVLGHNGKAKRS